MKITYIHHSSFLVELDQVQMLFDYVEGPLPNLDGDKDLLVFASHRHGDHFSPKIFDLANHYPKVRYVLSDDIWQNRVPQERICRVEFVDPGMVLDLKEGAGTRVTTLKSTDEGVAFWVENGDLTLYHAGDLNNWYWKGEDKAWNQNMAVNYRREIETLKDRCPDLAFLPLDGRLEEWFYLGLHEFMQVVGAKKVFPMHFWENYALIDQLEELEISKEYGDRIVKIKEKGEIFQW